MSILTAIASNYGGAKRPHWRQIPIFRLNTAESVFYGAVSGRILKVIAGTRSTTATIWEGL
jgi:hypothetical protein